MALDIDYLTYTKNIKNNNKYLKDNVTQICDEVKDLA